MTFDHAQLRYPFLTFYGTPLGVTSYLLLSHIPTNTFFHSVLYLYLYLSCCHESKSEHSYPGAEGRPRSLQV